MFWKRLLSAIVLIPLIVLIVHRGSLFYSALVFLRCVGYVDRVWSTRAVYRIRRSQNNAHFVRIAVLLLGADRFPRLSSPWLLRLFWLLPWQSFDSKRKISSSPCPAPSPVASMWDGHLVTICMLFATNRRSAWRQLGFLPSGDCLVRGQWRILHWEQIWQTQVVPGN